MNTSGEPMRCAMTDIVVHGSEDAIWDDGEWISWEWINRQIEEQESGGEAEPLVDAYDEDYTDPDEVIEAGTEYEPSAELLRRMLAAKSHYEKTANEISPDWGAIGEAYIAEKYGAKLCSRHTQGHDARFANEVIEIKTITPHKRKPIVAVKRAGNFSLLAVVLVTPALHVSQRFISRNQLPPGNGGRRVVVTWNYLSKHGSEYPPWFRRGFLG